MKILKFGGSSVGSAYRIKKLAPLITNNQQKIVVLSAISGTTNELVLYSNLINQKEYQKAQKCCDNLTDKYKTIVDELFVEKKYKDIGYEIISHHFSFINSFNIKPLHLFKEKNILT